MRAIADALLVSFCHPSRRRTLAQDAPSPRGIVHLIFTRRRGRQADLGASAHAVWRIGLHDTGRATPPASGIDWTRSSGASDLAPALVDARRQATGGGPLASVHTLRRPLLF